MPFSNEQIDIFVRIILYISIFSVLIIMLLPFFQRRKVAYKRFKNLKEIQEEKKATPKFLQEIESDLSIVLGKSNEKYPMIFLVITASLFLIPYVVLVSSGISFQMALIFSFVICLIPYVIIKIKLHGIRIDSSYEGNVLLVELTNQYTINYLNMAEAIHKTLKFLDNSMKTKRNLAQLSIKLDKFSDEKELERAINEFVYSINTSWATALGNNIHIAISQGDDVSLALDDIIDELKALNEIHEQNKESNFESYLLTYLVPGGYIISVIALFNFFGFNMDQFIQYQFVDELGLRLFLILIVCMVINFGLYIGTRKPMNDFD